MTDAGVRNLAVRYLAYIAVVALVSQIMVSWGSSGYGTTYADDNGPIETANFLLAVFTAVILLRGAKVDQARDSVLRVFAMLSVFAAGRELDAFSSHYFFHHAYWLITAPAITVAVVIIVSDPGRFAAQFRSVLPTPAFSFLLIGLITVTLFAQLIGQKGLWTGVVGSFPEFRPAKNIAEEGIELYGYLLIAFGAVEMRCLRRAMISDSD